LLLNQPISQQENKKIIEIITKLGKKIKKPIFIDKEQVANLKAFWEYFKENPYFSDEEYFSSYVKFERE